MKSKLESQSDVDSSYLLKEIDEIFDELEKGEERVKLFGVSLFF